jgi:hypothetical protein
VESIAGHSQSSNLVRTPSRNARLDAQDSSNRRLKRRFDTTVARDIENVQHREPQNRRNSQSQPLTNSVALPEHGGDLSMQARSGGQTYGVPHDESAAARNSEETSYISGTVPQASTPSAERDVHVGPVEEAYDLPSHTDETWTAQDISSFGEITSMDMAMLPDHVLSPSISSSYNLEDGIFEPGSAYQNLFQSLRSHVFRTAQIESDVSENSHAPVLRGNPIVSGHSDTSGDRSTRIAGSTTRNGNTTNGQRFELAPAQEYLLWKAWTEEVSIWVCYALLSFAAAEADKNIA